MSLGLLVGRPARLGRTARAGRAAAAPPGKTPRTIRRGDHAAPSLDRPRLRARPGALGKILLEAVKGGKVSLEKPETTIELLKASRCDRYVLRGAHSRSAKIANVTAHAPTTSMA